MPLIKQLSDGRGKKKKKHILSKTLSTNMFSKTLSMHIAADTTICQLIKVKIKLSNLFSKIKQVI